MEPLEILAQLLNTGVDEILDRLILVVSSLATIGLLTMATIDLIKVLLLPRLYFHRWLIRREMRRGLSWFPSTDTKRDIGEELLRSEILAAELASAGDLSLLYDQSTEDCLASIKSAVNVVLIEPTNSEHELLLKAWCENTEQDRLKQLQDLVERRKTASGDDLKLVNEQISGHVAYLNAYIDSNFNGMSLRIVAAWNLLLRVVSVVLSTMIIWLIAEHWDEWSVRWAALAVLGGLFAPFAHDFLKGMTAAKAVRL